MNNLRLIYSFSFFATTCVSVAFFSGLNITVFMNAITILGALTIISATIQKSTKNRTLGNSITSMPKQRHIVLFAKLVSICIISAFPVILLGKIISFLNKSGEYSRLDWLQHYSDHLIFLFLNLLWPLLICLQIYKFYRSKISVLDVVCVASVCAIMLLDGTRVSFLFFTLALLIFRPNPIRTKKAIWIVALLAVAFVMISFFRFSIPFTDFLARLFQNLFHSFSGGFFLYEEHQSEIIHLPSGQYHRPWIIKSMPGLDIFVSTLVDKLAGTDWSLSHFGSIFWEMNDFRLVESLGVPMNSYYTALLFGDIVGSELSVLLILPVLISASQPDSFFSKLSTFWICSYLVSFPMYFININMGFALVFLISFCHGLVLLALHLRCWTRHFVTPE